MAIYSKSVNISQAATWYKCSDPAPVDGRTVNINIVNLNIDSSSINVDISISTNAVAPGEIDLIEEFTKVSRGYPLIRTGEPLKQGEIVYVRVNKPSAIVRVSGFDKL